MTSISVPGALQTQAALRSQERAHILIAICVPFNRKIIHQSRNAGFPQSLPWANGFEAKALKSISNFEESYAKPVVRHWGQFCSPPPFTPGRGEGALAMSANILGYHSVGSGCPWHLVGRGLGYCPTSCNTQDGSHNGELVWQKT